MPAHAPAALPETADVRNSPDSELGPQLAKQQLLPVLTITELDTAVPLAASLAAAGLTTIEITLRTDFSLKAIGRIARELPNISVGAGTITSPHDMDRALEAGASFLVSPGSTQSLYRAASEVKAAWIPGVATASEVMRGLDAGLELFKFFPAASVGGARALAALNGPLPAARFCPTGGIHAASVSEYLRLDNVVAVGGSWMVPSAAVQAGDWNAVTGAARAATRWRDR